MADTCGECESWAQKESSTRRLAFEHGRIVPRGMCRAVPDDARMHAIYTWADNGACPAFKRRADAAERAAREIAEAMPTMTAFMPPERMAEIIKKHIAKDKEAR